ncbi:MAG: hypothetical protein K2X76_10755 [Sphingomonas sp.]|nr:hypothetical protein [Sphingomonas sp.]
MNLRFNSRNGSWPRDFPGHVFLGTALAYLNRALHADARDLDVTTTIWGRQPGDLPLFVNVPPDLSGYHRAQRARMILGGEIFKGSIAAFVHEDGAGAFHPMPADAWKLEAEESLDLDTLAACPPGDTLAARISELKLPDALSNFNAQATISDQSYTGYVYVDRSGFNNLMDAVNARTSKPSFGEPLLPVLAQLGVTNATHWDFLAAALWLITSDNLALSGAANYLAGKGRSNVSPGSYRSLFSLLDSEIRDHHCRCRRAICHCFALASGTIKAACARGEIEATALKFGEGDRRVVPAAAWLGHIEVQDTVRLAPEALGGTVWEHILFDPKAIRSLQSPFAEPKPTGANAFEAPPPAADRRAMVEALAKRLQADGIRKGRLRASDIAARWPADSGSPPGMKEVAPKMENRRAGRRPTTPREIV